MLPISDAIIITDTTLSPAEQLKQDEVKDGGKDDGKTVINTVVDDSRGFLTANGTNNMLIVYHSYAN